MDPDRFERLVTQILEEARAFRQEVNEKLAAAAQERRELRRDMGLLQSAVLETANGLKEVRESVNRVEAKLDETIADHGVSLDKLEGAA